jgi:glucuronosyltransferase
LPFLFVYCFNLRGVTSRSGELLGISPVPSSSHFLPFQSLLRRLAEKGHNVDIATHFVSSENPEGYEHYDFSNKIIARLLCLKFNWSNKMWSRQICCYSVNINFKKFIYIFRYNQLSLTGSLPILINNISVNDVESLFDSVVIYFMTKVCGVHAFIVTLQTPALQDLKKSQKKYDLVITEIFGSDCMLGFGHFFDVPTISLITSTLLPWAAYIPSYFFSSAGNLYERLENTIAIQIFVRTEVTFMSLKFHICLRYAYFSFEESNVIAKEFFGSNMPSLEKLA